MVSPEQLSPGRAALRALLGGGAAGMTVLVGKSADPEAFVCPGASPVQDRQIPAALRGPEPPTVVVVGTVGSTLLRALRNHPPALVVVTGDLDASTLASLEGTECLLLGPHARLAVGDGQVVALATSPDELSGLARVLPQVEGARIRICPVPEWIVEWLSDPTLVDRPALGYVMAESLSLRWARWARPPRRDRIIVPLGVRIPSLEESDTDPWARAVAAQTLETLTGPVFPAPRVLTRLLRDQPDPVPPTPERRALWDQARRALPGAGSAVGMEAPRSDLSLDVPTAAFLAQRVRLRMEERLDLLDDPELAPPATDDDNLERAHQVLAGAGQVLSDHESKVVLRAVGLEVTRQAVASSATGAAHFAETIGFPVVLKALSPDLRRKQEIGCVMLDLPTAAAVRRAYSTIARNMEEHAPTARLDGVLVSELIGPGVDVHCGALRLPGGETVLWARALSGPGPIEPVMALCPVDPGMALVIAQTVLSRIPHPALRRDSDPNAAALARVFLALDHLLQVTGDRITGVDLNPARWVHDAGNYVVLDARVTQRAHLEGL